MVGILGRRVVVLLLALANTVYAESPCKNVIADDDVALCLSEEFESVDKQLNIRYKELKAKLLDDEHRKLFKDAQLAWIRLRDKDCELHVYVNKGGAGYNNFYVQCQMDKTKRRIEELNALVQVIE